MCWKKKILANVLMTLCFTMLQHLIKTSLNHLFNVDQGKMLLDIIEEQQ